MPAAAPRSSAILGAALLLLAASGASAACPPQEIGDDYLAFWSEATTPTSDTVPGFPLAPGACCPAGKTTLDITFKFDYGGDIEWKLVNASGNAVYRRDDCPNGPYCLPGFEDPAPKVSQFNPFWDGFVWTDRVCLEPGHYKLWVRDITAWQDGMTAQKGSFIKLTWQDCAQREKFVYGPVPEPYFQELYFGSGGYDDDGQISDILSDIPDFLGLTNALEVDVTMFPAGFNCDVDSWNFCNPKRCSSEVTQHTVRFNYDITKAIAYGIPGTPPKNWTLYKGHNPNPSTPAFKNRTSLQPWPLDFDLLGFEDSFCLKPGNYTLVVEGSDAGEKLYLPAAMYPDSPLGQGLLQASPNTANKRTYTFEICNLGFKYTISNGCVPTQDTATCIGASFEYDFTGDVGSGDRIWPDEKFCVSASKDVGSCEDDCGAYPADNGTNCMSGQNGLQAADDEFWHYTNGTRAEVGFELLVNDPLQVQWVKQIKFKPAVLGKIKAVIVQVSGDGDCGYKNLGAWTSEAREAPDCGGSQTCDGASGFTQRIQTDADWEFIVLPNAPGAIGTPAKFVSLTFIVAKAGDFKMDMIELIQCDD